MRYVTGTTDTDFFDGRAKWIWSDEAIWGPCPDPRPVQCRWFARKLTMPAGGRIVLALSADTRYMLYVNGVLAARGPQKGDVAHQFFDVLDLTDEMKPGENLLLVRVEHYGKCFSCVWPASTSASLMSAAPLFVADGAVIDGDGREAERVASDPIWLVRIDPALTYLPDEECSHYTGFLERFDQRKLPEGFFAAPDLADPAWKPATVVHTSYTPENVGDAFLPHRLVPRSIAPLAMKPGRFAEAIAVESGKVRSLKEVNGRLDDQGVLHLSAPAHTKVLLRLKADELRTAYPALRTRGGRDATVSLKYSERLLRDGVRCFDSPEAGDVVFGYRDVITIGGGRREWTPLHWRTFRYIELEIETGEEPLEIESLGHIDCHYPIEPAVELTCSEPTYERFWRIGVRTQQGCSHETFEDCPYYEQLQYAGDTQAQMLFTYALSGVTDLPLQAIRFFHWSRLPEGLTHSRYPSRPTQVIPYWSLHYLMMLHDWYIYTGDAHAIRHEVLGALDVLRWFLDRRGDDGLVGALRHWCVADWSPQWEPYESLVPGSRLGPTALTNFMVIAAAEGLAELHDVLGEPERASRMRADAVDLRGRMTSAFWRAERGVYIDSPHYEVASQLTNAWAILTDAGAPGSPGAFAERIATDESLCRAAFFGHFYTLEAFRKAGRPDLVINGFDTYRKLAADDISTWPEAPRLGRSECHAWSNAATYQLLRTVLGISVTAPGCKSMHVEPYVDGLESIRGGFVTPRGPVIIAFEAAADRPFRLDIPAGVTVDFEQRGACKQLGPGSHRL